MVGGAGAVVAGMVCWGVSLGAQESALRAAVAAMAPSKQDLRVGLGSFVVICLVIGLAALSPLLIDYFSFLDGFARGMERVLTFALIMLALLAAAAGGTYLLLGRTLRKGVKYEPLD